MSSHVFWNLECAIKPGQLDNLKTLMAEMIEATQANEPGALNYEWFISEDEQRLHLYERYVDSAATMTHLEAFGKNFARRFLAALEIKRYTVYGDPDDQVKKALGANGATFMTSLGGFTR